MSEKTDYLEEALIDHVLRNTALTSPTTVYVALFTSAPGETGGGTEVSGGAYARQSVAFAAPSQVSDAAETSNSSDVTFPEATADWGTVTDFGIFDASTGGNMFYYSPLDQSKVVSTGDTAKFSAGALKVSEA